MVADSLVFSSRTKKVTLYRDPIVWSDNKQIVGEEINAYMNDSTLDSIYVDRQALTIERVDSTHFNQVASQQMRTYFDTQGEVKENRAIGNVMVVNYPLERIALSFTKLCRNRTGSHVYAQPQTVQNMGASLARLLLPHRTGTCRPHKTPGLCVV